MLWRWIFYLNVPVGLLAYLMCRALVEDPEYLQVERAKNRNRREPFDVLGLCLLTVTMVCWEVMLSKGVYVVGFSFPVVPRGQARIRTQISAAHEREHLDRALAAFGKVGRQLGVIQ